MANNRHTMFYMNKEYPNFGGGSGSGGAGVEMTTLLEPQSAPAVNTDYTLSDSIDNYDFIAIYNGIFSEYQPTSDNIAQSDIVSVETLNEFYDVGKWLIISNYDNRYMNIKFHGTTMRIWRKQDCDVCKVVGIKFSGGSSGGGSASEDYSTTEQEIGTWINGEKLYRIVIHHTTTLTNNTWTTIATLSNCVIKRFSGLAYWSQDFTNALAIDYANPAETQYIATSIHNDGTSFSVRPQLSATIYGCDVVLEYIKTTS